MASTNWLFIGVALCAWAVVECQIGGMGGGMVGGMGQPRPADDDVKRVVQAVQGQIASRAGLSANAQLVPVSYTVQVVAGLNYFVKIRTGQTQYLHARIYKDLQQHHSLAGVRTGQTSSSPIEYF
ncbi:cystatin-A1-like [Paramacrobiotus metropolitanus]|uniref:cystatin-A1-like n=1 Tax=Paramacrobiotus metropolitanus TaxID=2943436 RepID=UPI0024461055|nr:cystatin-A1-like [Paramacrobiotus metropolitanus]